MTMFTLCVKDSFSAAHRLEDYHGKCEELHGHNFTVEAIFTGEKPRKDGMVVDFKILKNYLKDIIEGLDHKYINELKFFNERATSSEFIAMYIFMELKKLSNEAPVSVSEVRVWESETAWASYSE
jgi:6-pyruvoyltetrahydropterin/6-carboxytetrahydropterin synthase